MKTVRTLVVILALALAVPASASDTQTVTFGDLGQGRQITGRTGNVTDIQSALVGPYLNVVIGDFDGPADMEGFAGETSVEVPADAIAATIAPDGTVSFTFAEPTSEPNVVELPDPVQPQAETELEPVPFPATANRLAALVG